MTQTALITGATSGLGEQLAESLAAKGWRLIIDARNADRLEEVAARLNAEAIAGDVTDPAHRAALADAAPQLDLLVNNASELGASPQPSLASLTPEIFRRILEVNLIAPTELTRLLLPALTGGVVLNISSDAAVEHYEGWGGYAASKAALDHITSTYAAENPQIAFYAVDPGDMRTPMHQAAFPGEDISDRPLPAQVVPSLLRLIAQRPPSGRYRGAEMAS